MLSSKANTIISHMFGNSFLLMYSGIIYMIWTTKVYAQGLAKNMLSQARENLLYQVCGIFRFLKTNINYVVELMKINK